MNVASGVVKGVFLELNVGRRLTGEELRFLLSVPLGAVGSGRTREYHCKRLLCTCTSNISFLLVSMRVVIRVLTLLLNIVLQRRFGKLVGQTRRRGVGRRSGLVDHCAIDNVREERWRMEREQWSFVSVFRVTWRQLARTDVKRHRGLTSIVTDGSQEVTSRVVLVVPKSRAQKALSKQVAATMTLLVPEIKFSIGKSPTTAPAASATNVDMSLGKFAA